MLKKITESEIELMECFYNPNCLAETLFSNYDNLSLMEEDKLTNIRIGQLSLLSYDCLLDYNEKLSRKENFQLKKGSADIYCLGGRLFGKTLFVEKVDLIITFIVLENEKIGFSSYDAIHIRGVLEDITSVIENHPVIKIFDFSVNRSPNYRIANRLGNLLESVNMNITGKKPGAQFFQKHFTRLYIEEASFETDEIYNKRRDSVSELGCVFRVSGMTNFTKYSPCGNVFYDLSRRTWVVNLPQYINPMWDDKAKEKAIKEFGGEQSIGFRIFVKGEVVEEGVSVFDMERIRKNYQETRKLKIFEITKENYSNFRDILILERPNNAEVGYGFADIGESASSEIGIIFEINKFYRYLFNITLYNLTEIEQFHIFKYILELLKLNFLALDCTEGTGRAIFRSLESIYTRKNLIWVGFNEKIAVDFEKDDKNNIIFKNGKPVYKEEYTSEWSVKRLKDLLYGEKIELPLDYKFDSQFNSIISMMSGARTVYSCLNTNNHLFQAFQVFAIAQWYNEFNLIQPVVTKTFCKIGV